MTLTLLGFHGGLRQGIQLPYYLIVPYEKETSIQNSNQLSDETKREHFLFLRGKAWHHNESIITAFYNFNTLKKFLASYNTASVVYPPCTNQLPSPCDILWLWHIHTNHEECQLDVKGNYFPFQVVILNITGILKAREK